jgi:hypothetical protein
MSIAGQFRQVAVEKENAPVITVLRQGIELVDGISRQLQQLDCLMLAGKPVEISEAASSIELALKDAAPSFAEIADLMGELGANSLMAAAAQLRKIEQQDAAGLAEALRFSLARFAKNSVSATRRAQQMNRGLNTALKALASYGMQEGGRLIAEA